MKQVALRSAGRLFGMGAEVRRRAYDRGWLPTYGVDVPVISVGNVADGGTGKSPFVQALSRLLSGRVAVVSRGYGRAERRTPRLVSAGHGPLIAPRFAGDEAWLLARTTDAIVVVDADRVRGAQAAVRHGAQLILLDDGFSHRRLRRELDIVLVDERPLEFLPAGVAREHPEALARAHLTATSVAGIEADVVFSLSADCVGPAFAPDEPAEALRGRPVALWSASARPEGCERTVRALGADVVLQAQRRDHQHVRPGVLRDFARRAKNCGAETVVTTSKDAARYAGARPDGFAVLTRKLNFVSGEARLRSELERVLPW